MRKSPIIGERRNIALHVVFKDSDYYPVNYLRNVALETVETEFVLSLDVDFITSNSLYERLVTTLTTLHRSREVRVCVCVRVCACVRVCMRACLCSVHLQLHLNMCLNAQVAHMPADAKKVALVIPAFETAQYRFKMPSDKRELIRQWDIGAVTTFREVVWPKGHAPTDYDKWRVADEPYIINWQEGVCVVMSDFCPALSLLKEN